MKIIVNGELDDQGLAKLQELLAEQCKPEEDLTLKAIENLSAQVAKIPGAFDSAIRRIPAPVVNHPAVNPTPVKVDVPPMPKPQKARMLTVTEAPEGNSIKGMKIKVDY